MVRRALLSAAFAGTLVIPVAIAQAAPVAAPCQFVLGFKTVHDFIPTIVGSCTDDEGHNPQNGDALQHTTGGLLVWRKADNWTAFTDGYHTWINGPNGLAERLNTQRFAWEANPDNLPVVGNTTPPAAPPPAAPSPSVTFSDQGIAILSGAKIANDDGDADILAFARNTTSQPMSTMLTVTLTDASGNRLGQAIGAVNDMQPGETRLVRLISQVPYNQASGGTWQVDLTQSGSSLPTTFKLSAPQIDPSDASAVLVTVQNIGNATQSASISIAITDANGGILGLAVGAVNDLAPGQSRTVDCITLLDSIPGNAHLTPQVDSVL